MMSVMELLAASPDLLIGTTVIFGLVAGSFLNVVIYRLPIMLERAWREDCAHWNSVGAAAALPSERLEAFNLVVPRSACPTCRTPISAWQNIPLFSYLLLRGRCRSCGARISPRYPLVEALTGVLSATVAWKFGFSWATAAGLIFTWFLVALTFIDIDHQLLPDNVTFPLLWLGLLLSVTVSHVGNAPIPVDPRSSLLGAIAGYVSLWSVYHLYRLITGKEGMGYGDFKLLAALGAWLGWQMLFPIILIAAVMGSLVGIALMLIRRRSGTAPIPFGPFLALAGWLMLLFGQPLVARYFGLFAGQP